MTDTQETTQEASGSIAVSNPNNDANRKAIMDSSTKSRLASIVRGTQPPASHKQVTTNCRDGGLMTRVVSAKTAIKMHCMECLGWDEHPKDCTDTHCALFPFRGKTLLTQKGDE